MADGRLVIGTKRYSSWSMRGWLMVHLARLDVDELLIPLAGGGATTRIHELSPNQLVPYLEHRGAKIWESIAIGEYCAEIEPALWPRDAIARAHARSIAAQMHASFRAVRMAMPMNLGRESRSLADSIADDVAQDIRAIDALWVRARALHGAGGSYLFGEKFGIADAMFAPVVARFLSYDAPLSPVAQSYVLAVREHPLVRRWYDEAALEPVSWQLDRYETIA